MKIGAWIHDYDDVSLNEQIELAAENGLQTIRSYHIGYAEGVVEALKRTGMSLLAGMPVDAEAMIDVDSTGAEALRQAITLLTERDITFAVSRADQPFRSWMDKYGLLELIDESRFYPTNRHAAAALRQAAE